MATREWREVLKQDKGYRLLYITRAYQNHTLKEKQIYPRQKSAKGIKATIRLFNRCTFQLNHKQRRLH